MPIIVNRPTTGGPTGAGEPGTIVQRRFATLGDLLFGGVDELGTIVYLNALTGWAGGATTGQVEQRAADHGGWSLPAYLAPKVVELQLTLRGASFAQVEESVSAIVSGLPLSQLETLIVATGDSALQADVRQEGQPLYDIKGASARMSFSLIAPDPKRYSIDVTTAQTGLPVTSGGLSLPISLPVSIGATTEAGVLTVDNAGDASTRPTFTVVGPSPAFAITHRQTGKTLRFNEAIPAGRSLVIDTDKRRALLDGTATRVMTGTWFEYTPGVNEVAFSAANYDPNALLVSEHRSAWR